MLSLLVIHQNSDNSQRCWTMSHDVQYVLRHQCSAAVWSGNGKQVTTQQQLATPDGALSKVPTQQHHSHTYFGKRQPAKGKSQEGENDEAMVPELLKSSDTL